MVVSTDGTDDFDRGWLGQSIKLPGPLKIPSTRRLLNRFYESSLSLPKMFLSAFLWEGFGLMCDYNTDSAAFFFMTGLGGGIGTFVGHLIAYRLAQGQAFVLKGESVRAALYGTAVFLGPGTLWQRVVNDTEDWDWSFTGAFFFMWLISGVIFFLALMAFRICATYFSSRYAVLKVVEPPGARIWSDLSLSVSVGLGDAFFMGTVPDLRHNWLSPAFGVHDDTEAFEAMVKSGTSVMLGFLLMQVVENLIFKTVWTDDAQEDADIAAQAFADTKKTTKLGAALIDVRPYDIETTTNAML